MITDKVNTINNDQKLNLIALNKNPYDAKNLDPSAAQRILREWFGGSLDGVGYKEKPLILLTGWTQISYHGMNYQAPDLIMEAGYPNGLAVDDFENRFSLRTPLQKDYPLTLNYFSPKNYFSDDDPVHSRKHGDSTHFFYPGNWFLECGHLLMKGHSEKNMWEVPGIPDSLVPSNFIKALSERYNCGVVESETEYHLQLPAAEVVMSKDSKYMCVGKTTFKDENHRNRDTLASLLNGIYVQTVRCDNHLAHAVFNHSSGNYVTPQSLDLPSSWATLNIVFTDSGSSNIFLKRVWQYADRLAKLGESK